jgi:TRAP-type C4-dicarboxylate transport system substrate-binding protein
MDLYNNTPYLKKELTGVKVLSIFTTDGFQLATKKPVTKIEDINGMKLRAPGGNVLAFMKSLGASPVSIPIGGVYQAMEKGICEGNLTPYEAHEQINTQELTKYVLDCNVAQSTFMVIMNQKKYDSLPADVKKVIDANSGLAGALTYTDAFDTTTAKIKDKFTKAGVKITEMTPEEEAKWIAAAKPIQDKWVADMTAQGYPAKEVLAKTKELVEKYKGQ